MSSKLEELRQFILKDLHSGATIYESIGAYDNAPRKEIIVIVNKNVVNLGAEVLPEETREDEAVIKTAFYQM